MRDTPEVLDTSYSLSPNGSFDGPIIAALERDGRRDDRQFSDTPNANSFINPRPPLGLFNLPTETGPQTVSCRPYIAETTLLLINPNHQIAAEVPQDVPEEIVRRTLMTLTQVGVGSIVHHYLQEFLRGNLDLINIEVTNTGQRGYETAESITQIPEPLRQSTENLISQLDNSGLLGLESLQELQHNMHKLFLEDTAIESTVISDGGRDIWQKLEQCLNNGLVEYLNSAGYSLKSMLTYAEKLTQDKLSPHFTYWFIKYARGAIMSATLDIILLTARSRKTPQARSTLENLCKSGCEKYCQIFSERYITSNPAEVSSKYAHLLVRQLRAIKESYTYLDLNTNTIFRDIKQYSTPIEYVESFREQIIKALRNKKVMSLIRQIYPDLDLDPEYACLNYRVFVQRLLEADETKYKGLALILGPHCDYLCKQAIVTSRMLRNFVHLLSGYIHAQGVSKPLASRPDIVRIRSHPNIAEKLDLNGDHPIRANDEIWREIHYRFSEFILWIREDNIELFSEVGVNALNLLENRILPIETGVAVKKAYLKFLDETNQVPLEIEITLFDFKTGGRNETRQKRIDMIRRRRMLILLLSLFNRSRLPGQNIQEWTVSPNSPFTWMILTGDVEINYNVLNLIGSLNGIEHINNPDSMFYDLPEHSAFHSHQFLPSSQTFEIQDEIPQILFEVERLYNEILARFQQEIEEREERTRLSIEAQHGQGMATQARLRFRYSQN